MSISITTPGVDTVTGLAIPQILSTTNNVDLLTQGSTVLYTVPTGKTAIALFAILRITAVTTVSVPPTVSLTDNASVVIFNGVPLNSVATSFYYMLSGGATRKPIVGAGGTIRATVAAGAAGTTLTGSIELIGYLV